MAIRRTTLVAFVLICVVEASQTVASLRNQYKAREDMLHPRQLFDEATDRAHPPNSFADLSEKFSGHTLQVDEKTKLSPLSDIQVGCAEGSVTVADPQDNKAKGDGILRKLRRKRAVENRKLAKRSYYNTWRTQIVEVPVDNYAAWQPSRYQISRPYYIPVWGSSGRIPLYFSPQTILVNPGYPIDNPPNRQYLPPDPRPPPVETTTQFIEKKFGEGDDGPVWDIVTMRPPPVRTTTASFVPTRRTQRPGRTTTFPPLIHNSGGSNSGRNNVRPVGNQLGFTTVRPTARTPPAFVQQEVEVPPREENRPASNQPSRCVWAIIACCSATSGDVSYSCFEQQGCTGAFWDTSPCNSDYARAAITSAMNYYNAK